VPVDTIARVVPQIIETGFAERVGLGIVPLEDDLAASLGIEGVVDRTVPPGSPAEKAGLRPAGETAKGVSLDVIVGIDDKRIRSFDDLYGALEEKKEGDVVKVSVRRIPPDEVVSLEVALIKLGGR